MSVGSIIYIDPIYQHNIPFVIVITIVLLSVHHGCILPYYAKIVHCSILITPQENTNLIVKTYPAIFSLDEGTCPVLTVVE